jgi:hypothetical protein
MKADRPTLLAASRQTWVRSLDQDVVSPSGWPGHHWLSCRRRADSLLDLTHCTRALLPVASSAAAAVRMLLALPSDGPTD